MNLNEPTSTGRTSYLARPDGRIGYDVIRRTFWWLRHG
jgi:hypothetical protein